MNENIETKAKQKEQKKDGNVKNVKILEKLNLHQKLLEVRKSIPYFEKTEEGYKFKYVPPSVILGTIKPKMDELGIMLTYSIEDVISEEIERTEKGRIVKTARVKLKYVFEFIDTENTSDKITKTIWTQGVGDDIKDMGGYNTYTLRYFLIGFFNIASDKDDPDKYERSIAKLIGEGNSVENKIPVKNSVKEKEEGVAYISDAQIIEIDNTINVHDDIRKRILEKNKELRLIKSENFDGIISAIKKVIADKEKAEK